MKFWEALVAIHKTGDVAGLAMFWGTVAAILLLLILHVRLVGARRLARKALEAARGLTDDLQYLTQQFDGLERRMEKRLDSRTTEIDARISQKLDRKGDLIQERLEERTTALSDSVNVLGSRVAEARDQIERFRLRVEEVEKRMPNFFDKIEEFRETLARSFQAELGSVLNSFDTSMTSILLQMKSELQMGISRIEGIEGMVRSRQRAERSLLGPPQPPELAEDEGEFEQWEQEAKELAEQPDEDDFEQDFLAAEPEQAEEEPDLPTDEEPEPEAEFFEEQPEGPAPEEETEDDEGPAFA